ncbi:Protein STR-23, partial [Aphelenchoides avenae]
AAFAEMVHEAEERDVLRRNEPSLACWTAHTGERPRYLAAYDDTLMGYGKYIFPICAANCTFCQTFFTACAFWTIRYLRKNRDARSEKSRRMHLQFVWLLLLQMFCPVACLLVPFAYLIFASLLGYRTSTVVYYLCMLGFTVFPAFNAILTILFVSPYRRRTAELLMSIIGAKRKVDSAALARVEQTEASGPSLGSSTGARMMQASTRRLRQVAPVPVV